MPWRSGGRGPRPELFRQVDPVTNMPANSALASLGLSALWLLYFYGANRGRSGLVRPLLL